VLTVNSDLVDFFEVSAKTTRRGDDKMDQKLGEMIAQSKVHLKALKHAKRYLKKTAEELMDECQSVADKLVQYEIAESKEYMHLDDLESGKIVKK
jgi:TRAP-type mannitol/chloroaromatic compound transport system substrate-binding protein